MVNEDCARDLLQYLDSCLEISSTGKRVKPIKLKKVLHEEPLGNYTSDDIYNAAESGEAWASQSAHPAQHSTQGRSTFICFYRYFGKRN